jgi:hypothetical protein
MRSNMWAPAFGHEDVPYLGRSTRVCESLVEKRQVSRSSDRYFPGLHLRASRFLLLRSLEPHGDGPKPVRYSCTAAHRILPCERPVVRRHCHDYDHHHHHHHHGPRDLFRGSARHDHFLLGQLRCLLGLCHDRMCTFYLQWTRTAAAGLYDFPPLPGLVLLVAAGCFFWPVAVYAGAFDHVLYVH